MISRLPQLLENPISLDGDECIVGLMSKHFIEGKEFPIFFYGQSYGFSFLEVLFIGVTYLFLGVSALAVKIGVLSLWIIGAIFFFLTLYRDDKNKSYLPLLIALILVCFPAWSVWALKARGGYVTAFTLSSIFIFILFKSDKKLFHYFIIGSLFILIYQSQPLWIPGLLVVLGYVLYREKYLKGIFSFGVGLLGFVFLFYLVKKDLSQYWSPGVISFENFTLENISSLPQNIYKNLGGNYHYHNREFPYYYASIVVYLFFGLMLISSILLVVKFIKHRRLNKFSAFTLAFIVTIGYTLVTGSYTLRYLLPLSGFLIYTLYYLLKEQEIQLNTKTINFSLIVIFILVFNSNFSLKNHPALLEHNLVSTIDELKEKNIKYVFSADPLVQWKIMFYSNESILARFHSNEDRYMPYIEKCNQSLIDNPTHVAIVGYLDDNHRKPQEDVYQIDNTFFIKTNVNKETLLNYGFKF